MKIISVVGWSGSGKTKLISRMVNFLKMKHQPVAVLKNVPHSYSLQPEGKDSYEFLDAGADLVFLTGQGEIIKLKKRKKKENVLETILQELGDVEVLILEGLTGKGIPIIEVFDPKKDSNLKFSVEVLSAVVSKENINVSLPCFHPDDVENIVKFMEENANE